MNSKSLIKVKRDSEFDYSVFGDRERADGGGGKALPCPFIGVVLLQSGCVVYDLFFNFNYFCIWQQHRACCETPVVF